MRRPCLQTLLIVASLSICICSVAFAVETSSDSPSSSSSTPRILTVRSLILPGESTPSARTHVPTDTSQHYARHGGGFDRLTQRGTAAALVLARELLSTYPVESVHIRTTSDESTAESAARLMHSIVVAQDAPTRNTSSPVQLVPEGEDLLLNAHNLCRHLRLQLNNQYWGNQHWRAAHLENRYLLERLSDVGVYKAELHLVDLIPYSVTAKLRRRYRDQFIAEFDSDFHWERMQDYMHDMIDRAANIARRLKFYGAEHDRMPARWMGGGYLMDTLLQLESQSRLASRPLVAEVAAASRVPEATELEFHSQANWNIAHEDVMLAVLTALDVMNLSISSTGFLVNVTLPSDSWHLDFVLTERLNQEPLVHIRYENKPLQVASPCRSSSLRTSSPHAFTKADNQFGDSSTPLSNSDACCTLSEFRNFVDDLLKPAFDHSPFPIEGQVVGPSESDFLSADGALPGFDDVALPASIGRFAQRPADAPVSEELWQLLFPDGVKETNLPVRPAAMPIVRAAPESPASLQSLLNSPMCPFAQPAQK